MQIFSFIGATASAVALLVFVSGCSSSDDPPTANVDELFEQGPFPVGFREISLTYPDAASGEDRTLELRVWYPAEEDSGAAPAIYAVAGVVEVPAPFSLDAPPPIGDSGLPLVVYSHGNQGEGLLAYPYGELMASHGWILVSPNHTGNTVLDGLLGTAAPFAASALNRPYDLTAIIDAFEFGLVGDELEGKADTARTLVFGHSFGGYTAFAAGGTDVDFDQLSSGCDPDSTSPNCEVLRDPNVEAAYRAGFGDPRVVAIAPQAPALGSIAEGELAALEVPTMLMSGRLDQTTTQATSAEPAWAGVDNPEDLWVEMPEGAHFSFVSICYDLDEAVINLVQPDAFEDGCGEGFIPAEEAVPVLAAYVFAFGRLHVLGESEWQPVLTGPPLNDGFVVTLP